MLLSKLSHRLLIHHLIDFTLTRDSWQIIFTGKLIVVGIQKTRRKVRTWNYHYFRKTKEIARNTLNKYIKDLIANHLIHFLYIS